MTAAIRSIVKHPLPCVFRIVEQPVDLVRRRRVMNGDAVVSALRVNEKLANAAPQFIEDARVSFGRRSKLPGFRIDELVIGQIGVPDQRSAVGMKQAPPHGATRPVLDQAVADR